MSHVIRILSQLKNFFFESRKYVLYHINFVNEDFQLDPEIKIYFNYNDIPDFVRKHLFKGALINPLFYRIRFQRAIFLCLNYETEIISYGWVQDWKSFKRKFGWLCKNGVMLGPYWTNPKFRGKGYYGRLLKHSIAVSNKNFHKIIYTSPENINSQKGIEKIGFSKIGTFRISFLFRLIQWHKKIN